MICPDDNQPCTLDHSMECYTTCARMRSLRSSGPYTHTFEPNDNQGPWLTVHKVGRLRRLLDWARRTCKAGRP